MLSWAIPWLPCCADGDTGVPFFSLADDDGTASLLLEQPIECAPQTRAGRQRQDNTREGGKCDPCDGGMYYVVLLLRSLRRPTCT